MSASDSPCLVELASILRFSTSADRRLAARSKVVRVRVLGSTMGSNDEFKEVTALFAAGKLRLPVDHVFPASEGVQAFAKLEAAEQFGKIVIRW